MNTTSPGPETLDESHRKEALRQQMLLRAIWRDSRPAVVQGWLRSGPPDSLRGLRAYQANAGASAERALAAAFPTVQQLLGAESFAAMARAHWHANPPVRGDLAQFGHALPEFIAAAEQLAEVPYAADCARLDWAVHCAEQAADPPADVAGIDRLAAHEPDALWLVLSRGAALVPSAYPVVTIWQAHRRSDEDRLDPARTALQAGIAETALVWPATHGHEPHVRAGVNVVAVPAADARFIEATLQGCSLGTSLRAAGDAFAFEPWLLCALRSGWIVGMCASNPNTLPPPRSSR